jgi:hypothetical protein
MQRARFGAISHRMRESVRDVLKECINIKERLCKVTIREDSNCKRASKRVCLSDEQAQLSDELRGTRTHSLRVPPLSAC